MSKQTCDVPRSASDSVYTGCGDQGETSLAGGHRAAKDSARIEAYGVVDELNAFTGSALALAEEMTDRNGRVWPVVPFLLRIQHELVNLGSLLLTLPEDMHSNQAGVIRTDVTRLEHDIDRVNQDLAALRSIALPGSGCLNAALQQCRAVCRRAERAAVSLARQEAVPPEAIQYLNRLSDAFFVWSRWASHVCDGSESLWDPNQPAHSQNG